jgi:ribose/xylose/arabinose/galactoside ABC-type transport system permease subunit
MAEWETELPTISPTSPANSTGPTANPSGSALVGSAITLGIGWVVAVGFLVQADLPNEILTRIALPSAFALVALAAPVALLLSRGEIDVSFIGTAVLAGYVFRETASSGVGVGLLAAIATGFAVGAAIGLARWLTRAPSAYVTLAGGLLVGAIGAKLIDDSFLDRVDDRIDGSGLPAFVGLGFTALAVLWAIANPPSADAAGTTEPKADLILGYSLSGAGAAAYGALFTSLTSTVALPGVGPSSSLFLALLVALGVGGVVRGSGFAAPLAAALGAIAVQLLSTALTYDGWTFADSQLLLATILVVCLLVAYLLPRVVSPTVSASSAAPGTALPG